MAGLGIVLRGAGGLARGAWQATPALRRVLYAKELDKENAMDTAESNHHPSTEAYEAGVALANRNRYATEEKVRKLAEKYDDPDSFIDGFYDRVQDI